MTESATPGADDVLRYAYRQGAGRDFVAPLGPPQRPLTTTFGTLPAHVATDPLCPLVWGTVDLLDDAPYPHLCAESDLSPTERLQHALVMAFGLQRREPSNMFNDHRGCASVRSRFPVHTYVQAAEHAWLLDVYRHGLLPIDGAPPELPAGQPLQVVLAGRYTHLPSLYGRLRGPLVELELGISLRNLWVALEVLGVSAELRLPGTAVGPAMARLGLDPPDEWSVPLTVAIGGPLSPSGPAVRPQRSPSEPDDDPTLAEVVAVNRTSLETAQAHPAAWRDGVAQAVPAGLSDSPRAWSQVLWHRSAGHMPRQMAGFSGRRRPLAESVLNDAVAWVNEAPPTPLLQAVAGHIKVSACLQDVAGYATGWYRLDPSTSGRGMEPVHLDANLPARLEACYGHGLGANVGSAVRHASMIWMLSADVTSLIGELGAGGWTLAQYVVGWMAHGLCLSAAAHGLYARPSRAFDEILLHPVVGMAPGEMVLLSVVSGTGRYIEPVLDLRT